MDDIDKMLQADDQGTVSPTENNGQGEGQGDLSQEEVEFNKLSGSAQDRVRDLLRRAKDAEEKAEQLQQPQLPQQQQVQFAPEQKQAIETLRQFGISTKDDVKQEVSTATAQIRYELEQSRLRDQYNGENNLPKYDPEEVEDYIKTHPQYAQTPRELVFKAVMFPDEFSGATQTQSAQKPKGQSLKPVKTAQRQDALTPEYIETRLQQTDGDEWYEANKDEINKVVANYTNQFKDVNFSGQ